MNALLSYDPTTGIIRWKVSRGGVLAGSEAGNLDINGYIRIQVSGKRYRTHRLAWLLHYGVWPTDQLDHINGVKTDNRICNLREATSSHNSRNCGKYANNTSGYKGVSWHKEKSRWRAQCRVGGNPHHLGYYLTKEEAYAAYCKFASEHHKEFFHE